LPTLPLIVMDNIKDSSAPWQDLAWIDRARSGRTKHDFKGNEYVTWVSANYAAPGKFNDLCYALREGCERSELAELINTPNKIADAETKLGLTLGHKWSDHKLYRKPSVCIGTGDYVRSNAA